MKPIQFLATACMAAGLTFLISCNSGDDKKAVANADTVVAKTDTLAAPPATVAPPVAGPSKVLVIMQKVANYGKWKAAYDAHDSARLANGLHNYVVARGTTDSNTVMVALRMDDVEKAKAFGASRNLKDVMKAAGVIGMPTITYSETVMEDNAVIPQMDRVMMKHKVKDWEAWKKSFDSHKQARMDAGLVDRVVSHNIDDDHQVSLVFAIADQAKAKAFMASKDLKDKMAEAGVVGPPTSFYFTIVEKH